MPVYEYKGVSSLGKKLSGVQDGESLKAVRARLKKDGVGMEKMQKNVPICMPGEMPRIIKADNAVFGHH